MAVVGLVSADIMETMILDKNYIGKFKVGKEQVNLKALLNFGATVVNSKTCG
jgi:membrane-bound acyltransferase YfiQ involved in biofilm formation